MRRALPNPHSVRRSPVARADLAAPRADADPAREIGLATADPSDVERSGQLRSVYTPLIGKNCSMTKEDTRNRQLRQGLSGRRRVSARDRVRWRTHVCNCRHPGRTRCIHSSIAEVIAPGASSLGTKAEWRFISQDGKVTPVALIVRVYTQDTDSRSPRRTSYLAVAKLTPTEICVTDRIPAAATANEEARRASVVSATRACLKPA